MSEKWVLIDDGWGDPMMIQTADGREVLGSAEAHSIYASDEDFAMILAAPQLLETLEAILPRLNGIVASLGTDATVGNDARKYKQEIEGARKALLIAKAKGTPND